MRAHLLLASCLLVGCVTVSAPRAKEVRQPKPGPCTCHDECGVVFDPVRGDSYRFCPNCETPTWPFDHHAVKGVGQ